MRRAAWLIAGAAVWAPHSAAAGAAGTATTSADPLEAEPDLVQSVLLGGLPGTFEIPGTGLSMAFGGFVKIDINLSSRSAVVPDFADQFVVPGTIPLDDNDGEQNQLTWHARESRIWWKAFRETDWGNFNAYIELDFLAFQSPGDEVISNSDAVRVRHAYGSLGPLLVGQTWTTFMNPSCIPDNLDFVGSVGTLFARQPLIRWTQRLDDAWSLVVALEQPETTITSSTGARLVPSDDRLADLVLGVKVDGDFGNVTLTAIGRELRRDDPGVDPETVYGGGVALAGRVYVAGRDNLRFNLNAGTALGRYLGLGGANDAFADTKGDLAGTIPSVGGHLAYQHHWNDLFRSSATVSFFQALNPDDMPAQAVNRQFLGGVVNLLFSPIPRTTFGIEYIYARRELRNGRSGVLHRGQSSAKFVF